MLMTFSAVKLNSERYYGTILLHHHIFMFKEKFVVAKKKRKLNFWNLVADKLLKSQQTLRNVAGVISNEIRHIVY